MTARQFPFKVRLSEAWTLLRAAAAAFRRTIPEDGGLEPLTPTILPPAESERHERELALAMTDPLVRNIAITGGYGAGKSSLIMTFKERHPGFKYALVSLATFRKDGEVFDSADDFDKDDTTVKRPATQASVNENGAAKPDTTALIDRIEEAIVQQLLYAVPAEKLPRTRLKRIVQPSAWRSAVATALIVIGAVAALRLFLVTAFPPRTLELEWLTRTLQWLPSSFALVMALVLGTYATYLIVRPLSLITIDGWSIKGGKVETMQHGSVLHKNVDELVYCFQNSEIDVVVVEDLDRFGIQDVFFRLREINAIINESPRMGRTVRFLYALNDELFAAGEKTKFFDVILPVVPVINKENSHAKMLERLEARKFGDMTYAQKLDSELVETVCYRIDDMRLVKNIVNEFDVFARVLMTGLRLDWNKLFAMIVIKNLHSDQYWQLTKRRGFLYDLINGYPDWRANHATEIRKTMATHERLLQKKKEDAARSKIELRRMAWYAAYVASGAQAAPTYIESANTVYGLAEFVEDETFDSVAASSRPQFFQTANRGRMAGQFQLSEVLKEMDYFDRLLAVSADDSAIQAELSASAKQLSDLQKMSLQQGMRIGYQDGFRDKLATYETIKYLLVSGYLDQDYPDYLGHFYGRLIGREDMNLLLSLRQGDECEVGTAIEDGEKLLRKLRLEHIDQGRGIIADLIAYLSQRYAVSPGGPYTPYLSKIFADAEARPERFAEAVRILVERGEGRMVIRAMFALRKELLAHVVGKRGLPDDDSRQAFLTDFLETLNLKQLQSLGDVGSSVADSLRALTRIAYLAPQIAAKTDGWRWLKAQDVRLGALGVGTSVDVLAVLVQADLLEPSLPMLWLLAARDPMVESDEALLTLDRLLRRPIEGSATYLKAHGRDVIASLLEQAGNLTESPGSVMQVVEWLGEDDPLTAEFFGRTDCTFASLDDLPRALWDRCLVADRVADRAGAVRSFEAMFHDAETAGDDEAGELHDTEQPENDAEMHATLSGFVVRHLGELQRTLWTDGEIDHRLKGWLLSEASLSDADAVILLSATMIDDPSLLTRYTRGARVKLLAEAGRLVLSDEMAEAIVTWPPSVQVSYFTLYWDQVVNTAVESLVPCVTAERLYLDGRMTLPDALRIFGALTADRLETPPGVELLEKLARDATSAGIGFSSTLSKTLAAAIASNELSRSALQALLPHAIPEMTWDATAAAFAKLGGGLETMHRGRQFTIDRDKHIDRFIAALQRRDAFSSLDSNGKQVTGRMRRNLT
jgi:hypothetical protein